MTILRKDVSKKDCWNVEALYPSLKAWEADFKKTIPAKKPPYFKELESYKGTVGKSAKELKGLLDLYFFLERKLRKLYTWAHLRHDEDIADETHKQIFE